MDSVIAQMAEVLPQDSLQSKLYEFANSDPEKFKQGFRRLRETFPDQATEACLWYIAAHSIDPAARQMVRWLANSNRYFEILFDPSFLPLEHALKAVIAMKELDPLFFSKFFKTASALSAPPLLSRALALFPAIGDYSALISLLRNLSRHTDDRVRSKAVKLLCELRPNKTLVERQMQSDDARVRSSALEAVWRAKSDETNAIFHAALSDTNHRVVSNALVGLHLQGDPVALEGMIQFSSHDAPLFRAAMAWALGHVRDPRATTTLEALSRDSAPLVRKRALKSLLALHTDAPAAAPELPRAAHPEDSAKQVPAVPETKKSEQPVEVPDEPPQPVEEFFRGFSSYK